MVTKGTITTVLDNNTYKVRVWKYADIDEDTLLDTQEARACVLPGCTAHYKVNDNVYVCILDTDLSDPVIMGKATEGESGSSGSNSVSDYELGKLSVNNTAKLPEDTSIGDKITPTILGYISSLSSDAQDQLNEIREQLRQMFSEVAKTITDNYIDGGQAE